MRVGDWQVSMHSSEMKRYGNYKPHAGILKVQLMHAVVHQLAASVAFALERVGCAGTCPWFGGTAEAHGLEQLHRLQPAYGGQP